MSATILDGKAISEEIRQELAGQIAEFSGQSGIKPCLAAVLVGQDPASKVYVRNKQRACERVGMESQLHLLDENVPQDELLGLIDRLNMDPAVHGVLVQAPLPSHIDYARILDAVAPIKDVDAFHPENVGLISQGRPRYLPCTPHGIQQLLHRSEIPVAGKHVVIVGRSDIVGKPMAMLMMSRDASLGPSAANATVTVCHSRTANLQAITQQADILIAAIGRPKFVKATMIRPGAVVVDVGINRTEDGLVGDVDFDAVQHIASHITPVPGGVGPLTVTMLLVNTLEAAKRQSRGE